MSAREAATPSTTCVVHLPSRGARPVWAIPAGLAMNTTGKVAPMAAREGSAQERSGRRAGPGGPAAAGMRVEADVAPSRSVERDWSLERGHGEAHNVQQSPSSRSGSAGNECGRPALARYATLATPKPSTAIWRPALRYICGQRRPMRDSREGRQGWHAPDVSSAARSARRLEECSLPGWVGVTCLTKIIASECTPMTQPWYRLDGSWVSSRSHVPSVTWTAVG
jgi:hypothetical protein